MLCICLLLRVTVRASCPMDLRLFPFDQQHCNLNIESCKYVLLLWGEALKCQICPQNINITPHPPSPIPHPYLQFIFSINSRDGEHFFQLARGGGVLSNHLKWEWVGPLACRAYKASIASTFS